MIWAIGTLHRTEAGPVHVERGDIVRAVPLIEHTRHRGRIAAASATRDPSPRGHIGTHADHRDDRRRHGCLHFQSVLARRPGSSAGPLGGVVHVGSGR